MAKMEKRANNGVGKGIFYMGIGEFVAALFALAGITSPIFGLLELIPLALVFVGFILVIIKWSSFSGMQKKLVLSSILVYIIGTAAFTVYVISLTLGSLGSFSTSSGALNATAYQTAVNRIVAQTTWVSPIVGVVGALALLLFPFGFSEGNEKKILYAAFAVAIIIQVAYATLLATGTVSPPTVRITGLPTSLSGQSVYQSYFAYLSVIPSLVFGFAYYLIGNRLRKSV